MTVVLWMSYAYAHSGDLDRDAMLPWVGTGKQSLLHALGN